MRADGLGGADGIPPEKGEPGFAARRFVIKPTMVWKQPALSATNRPVYLLVGTRTQKANSCCSGNS